MKNSADRAPDPRPQRTRAAIYAAAWELGESGEEVTVHALSQRAGVSRAGFYSHFSSLDDVACGLIEEILEGEQERGEGFATDDLPPHELIRNEVYVMAEFVAARRESLQGILTWRVSYRVQASIIDTFAAMFELAYDVLGPFVPEGLPHNSVARFHAAGILELIQHWLQQSEHERPQGQNDLEADTAELAGIVLHALPPWYTGIPAGAPIPPRYAASVPVVCDHVLEEGWRRPVGASKLTCADCAPPA